MKKSIFPRLALTSIKKNRKLYIPYIFSCIGAVMMMYIANFLSTSEAVTDIRGGNNLALMFSMGKIVIAVFSLLFLLYTNSFLSRRRNKEFGLYNILGMDKKSIGRIIFRESLIVSVLSIVSGIFFGIVFSKLSEMCLLYFSKTQADFNFSVSFDSIKYTVILFAIIFFILFIKSIISVRKADMLELMNSEKSGEKPVKSNWIFAILGIIILGAAYTMAVTIKSPISAIFSFVIAVIMVIVATYLLFIAGSVAFCKLLQKNKNYYYKKNHFVSVSSMVYRMKRNGAGLASICILSTMVLVMIASSASLYFGAENSLKNRFPQENQIAVQFFDIDEMNEKQFKEIRGEYENVFKKHKVEPKNLTVYSYATVTGLYEGDSVNPDAEGFIDDLFIVDNIRIVYFMPVEDYNKICGTDFTLSENEAMVYTMRCKYEKSAFNMNDLNLNIKGTLDTFPEMGSANTIVYPSIFFIISDMSVLKPLDKLADYTGDKMLQSYYYYGFDLDAEPDETINIHKEQINTLKNLSFLSETPDEYSYKEDCLCEQRDDFYTTFGGLFFIGILLSIIFIFAMTMIIYYKQISEGYEDRGRFEIMKNVGMTNREIKKTVNSQILTVFFAPLIFAGIHLCFSFVPVWRMLQLFGLTNLPFVICVNVVSFFIFGIFYALIYKATAKSYFSIVSSENDE